MSATPNRRGLLRRLAGLLGWGAAVAAAPAATPAPARCRHYYDGVLWCPGRPGRTGHYDRDETGCPFCRAKELARAQGPPRLRVTTYVGDASGPLGTGPPRVTTYTSDGGLRLMTEPGGVTTYASDGPPRQRPG